MSQYNYRYKLKKLSQNTSALLSQRTPRNVLIRDYDRAYE